MSVLIPGMEMPKNRAVYIAIDNGEVFIKPLGSLHWTHLDEKAVEIPDHGRLIDADAFFKDLIFPTKEFEKGMRELVGDAPTVIPADPAKEGEG